MPTFHFNNVTIVLALNRDIYCLTFNDNYFILYYNGHNIDSYNGNVGEIELNLDESAQYIPDQDATFTAPSVVAVQGPYQAIGREYLTWTEQIHRDDGVLQAKDGGAKGIMFKRALSADELKERQAKLKESPFGKFRDTVEFKDLTSEKQQEFLAQNKQTTGKA